MKTVCFTGHRPNKLGGYDWDSPKNQQIMNRLRETILEIMNKYPNEDFKFICGGALGVDQMAFEIVSYGIQFSNSRKYILELAIPFENQPIKWFNKTDINRYNGQKEEADIVTYVDKLDNYKIKGYAEDIYYPAKMQKRNEYMVDNSDIVIAVWDGTKGGTYNCVQYAKKKNKEIIQINPKEFL